MSKLGLYCAAGFLRNLRLRYTTLKPSRFETSIVAGMVLGVTGALLCISTVRTIHSDSSSPDTHSNKDKDPFRAYRSLSNYFRYTRYGALYPLRESLYYDWLKSGERAGYFENSTGVSRFHMISVPKNFQPDDYQIFGTIKVNSRGFWSLFAILDAHDGPETRQWLNDKLIKSVVKELSTLYSKYTEMSAEYTQTVTSMLFRDPNPNPPADAVNQTIKDTFMNVDDNIVNPAPGDNLSSKAAAVESLAPAQSRSGAILAFYEQDTSLLRIALVGDSRALLGRRIKKRKGKAMYEVHVLSTEQDANNSAEIIRLRTEHPNENFTSGDHILHHQPSRTFGAGAFKWNLEIQDRLSREYPGYHPDPRVKTPPYLSAQPEITVTTVKPGDFLVMATKGLWECLTNEEVVGLVGWWTEEDRKNRRNQYTTQYSRGDTPAIVLRPNELPVRMKEDDTIMYRRWGAKKRFVKVDSNAATHLARNALGGADNDLREALLNIAPPRTQRSEISATVVFFDE